MPECRKRWRFELASLTLFLMTVSIAAAQSSKAQPHPKRPVAAPQVTGVRLRPIKTSMKKYSCPASFTLLGEISTNGATKVKYTWVSSDGRSWPQRALTFTAAGLQSVSQVAKFGTPGKSVSDSIQLSVLSPNAKLSNKVLLAFACAK
jgi:hypothetical protein